MLTTIKVLGRARRAARDPKGLSVRSPSGPIKCYLGSSAVIE